MVWCLLYRILFLRKSFRMNYRSYFCTLVSIRIFAWLSHVTLSIAPEVEQKYSHNSLCLGECSCGNTVSSLTQQRIRTINCSFAEIKALPDALPNDLQALILKRNLFHRIPDTISKFSKLQELDLSGNEIQSIGRRGVFKNLHHLIYLNIGSNIISTIFHSNFIGTKYLMHLILSDNKINYIEDGAFTDSGNLISLDLQQNLLVTVYKEWYIGLNKLVTLNLSYNKLKTIPAAVFRSLPSLECLYLTGNLITFVGPRSFSGLTNLRVLNLDGNLISRTPTAAFQSLPALEALSLNKNPINKIRPLDFSHLTAASISLSRMQELQIIDAKSFYNLVNISSLYIHDNEKLTYVDPLAFMNVDSLTELQLHHNKLAGLQREILKYLPEGVHLTFHGNYLKCDCNARWLQDLALEGNRAQVTIVSPENISCYAPSDLQGKNIFDKPISKVPELCPPEMLDLFHKTIIEKKVGERQALECRALGSPIPRLHWLLPDRSTVNSSLNEVRRRFFPPGTLVYYHLKPTDGGLYTCKAENSVGSTTLHVRLIVSGIDIYLFPAKVSSTSVTLFWNGTDQHSFSSYKIIYRNASKGSTRLQYKVLDIESPSVQMTVVENLLPSSAYQFCIGYEDKTKYWLQISCCNASTQMPDYREENLYNLPKIAIARFTFIFTTTVVFISLIFLAIKFYRKMFCRMPKADRRSLNGNQYQPLLKPS